MYVFVYVSVNINLMKIQWTPFSFETCIYFKAEGKHLIVKSVQDLFWWSISITLDPSYEASTTNLGSTRPYRTDNHWKPYGTFSLTFLPKLDTFKVACQELK